METIISNIIGVLIFAAFALFVWHISRKDGKSFKDRYFFWRK